MTEVRFLALRPLLTYLFLMGSVLTDNHHQALGEPSNGEDLSEISGDEAMVDTESAGNMQTAGVNTSTGDTYRLAAFPYYYSIDNDALAKQKALALGLELADYTVSDQGPGARMEGEDGVEVKMEEGHEVEIKMEVEDE